MRVLSNQYYISHSNGNRVNRNKPVNSQVKTYNCLNPFKSIPLEHKYYSNINFTGQIETHKTIPDVEHEEYMAMSNATKWRLRKKYFNFFKDKSINKSELYDQKFLYMPLRSERDMDEFIKTSKVYFNYKENPIICLGRSPKWFLNAAQWMKGGIKNYKFVAFSKYWYRPDYEEGMKKIPSAAPKPEEELAYRKYLKRLEVDPMSIVKRMDKTGKKTVITDYICSGKGACSFLEVMANYANNSNILEDFSKSIQFVGIGSMDYMEELNPYADSFSEPTVPMPEILRPYDKNIKQEFYDMDYQMFRDMLLNQNTNECRSTYYPHDAWTVYKPDKFKTGLIKDMKKVKEMEKQLKQGKTLTSFTPAMHDYRNLLNFRILDGLWQRGLLKTVHVSKI